MIRGFLQGFFGTFLVMLLALFAAAPAIVIVGRYWLMWMDFVAHLMGVKP